jgi:hypothetical protein
MANDKVTAEDICNSFIKLIKNEVQNKNVVDDNFADENKYTCGYAEGWNDCLTSVVEILERRNK